jgi:soluble lytic murein transglycosylase
MGVVGARATSAALLVVWLAAGCLQDASRRPSATTPLAAARVLDAAASRATFADALARYRRGALDEARPLFRSLVDAYPLLADYHLWYLAAIEERTQHPAEAAALDDRLLREHPASVWTATAAARRARTALALGDPRTAELAEHARKIAGDDADAGGVALTVLASLRSDTDPRGAYALYHEVRRGGGEAAAAARDASTRLEATHPELLQDPALLLAEGRVLATEARLDLAAARLQAAADHAGGTERIAALEALAKVHRQAGRLEDAIAVYEQAMRLAPTGGVARFDLASLYWNRDRDADARVLFMQIVAERPRHPKYDNARYALARIAEQAGRTDDAVAQLRELAGGESDLAREARWRLAWMPYWRGDLPGAAEAFAALGAGDDRDRVAAAYWTGRVLARLGRVEESRRAFQTVLAEAPEGYYADLAEGMLANAAPPPAPPTPAAAAPPAAIATTHAYHWERSRELQAMAMSNAAAREIAALVAELPEESQPFLLEAYRDVEAHGRALRLAQRLQAILSPSTFAAYQFPRAYWSLVVQAADAARLDPYLALALMRQESLFDPGAVSPAAAYGLMQLLVPTASRVAGRPVEAASLVDPATNIALGTRYLRGLLDRFDGDLPKALAAYNAGPEAVAKWERRAPVAPSDEFVESISYRETRHYVKQVLGNYRRYRRLYGAPGEQRALVSDDLDDQQAGGNASTDTSFLASPPNPPFDIITTTSPGAT